LGFNKHSFEEGDEELANQIFEPYGKMGYAGFVVLWKDGVRLFSSMTGEATYDLLIDTAKHLAMFPVNLPELVEGMHIHTASHDMENIDEAIDLMVRDVAIQLPAHYRSIVFATDGEMDSLFVMGEVPIMTQTAIAGASILEMENNGSFDDARIARMVDEIVETTIGPSLS
jgi:hypothetical protein